MSSVSPSFLVEGMLAHLSLEKKTNSELKQQPGRLSDAQSDQRGLLLKSLSKCEYCVLALAVAPKL